MKTHSTFSTFLARVATEWRALMADYAAQFAAAKRRQDLAKRQIELAKKRQP